MRPRALLLVLALSACSTKQRTALVVEVDSNLAVPGQIDRIEIAVTAAGKTQRLPYSLTGGYVLPLRTGLVESQENIGTVDIVATGLLGSTLVVSQEAIVSFVEGQTRLLKLFLAAECVGNPCADSNKTCTQNGVCIDKARPPTSLVPFDPSKLEKKRDAGADASDGGRTDAGDASQADGRAGDAAGDTGAGELSKRDTGPDASGSTDVVDVRDALVTSPEVAPDRAGEVASDASADLDIDVRPDTQATGLDLLVPLDQVSVPDQASLGDLSGDPGIVPPDAQTDAGSDVPVPDASSGDGHPDSDAFAPADAPGDATVPPDVVTSAGVLQVSTGPLYSCALRADRTVACWGINEYGQSAPPAGQFKHIDTGLRFGCGIRDDGTIACWGDSTLGYGQPPSGVFTELSVGRSYACAVANDSKVMCWGQGSSGETTPPEDAFRTVAAGWLHTCGLRTDGTARCWGYNLYGQASPPTGAFLDLTVGESFSCGIRPDRTIVCWGQDLYGILNVPSGMFLQIAAGTSHVCARKEDGTVLCWGDNSRGQTTPPAVKLAQIGPAYDHTCGLTADGTVVCWQRNAYGESSTPMTALHQVAVGTDHVCGLHNDGSIACWGDNTEGECVPPAGTFRPDRRRLTIQLRSDNRVHGSMLGQRFRRKDRCAHRPADPAIRR